MNNIDTRATYSNSSKLSVGIPTPSPLGARSPQSTVNSPKVDVAPRIEHQFLNRMPDINSVESDLMKLLNEFSDTRLKKYGIFW